MASPKDSYKIAVVTMNWDSTNYNTELLFHCNLLQLLGTERTPQITITMNIWLPLHSLFYINILRQLPILSHQGFMVGKDKQILTKKRSAATTNCLSILLNNCWVSSIQESTSSASETWEILKSFHHSWQYS